MSEHNKAPWQDELDLRISEVLNSGATNAQISRMICQFVAKLIVSQNTDLLEACKVAKKYLEPDLVEPGRTVFWSLVSAISKAEGTN